MTRASRNWLIWLAVSLCFLLAVYTLRGILLPFVAGIMVAYFLDPVTDRLEAWKLKRHWATIVVLSAFFILGGVALMLLAPVVYRQLIEFLHAAPQVMASLRDMAEAQMSFLAETIDPQQVEQVREAVRGQANGLAGLAVGLVEGAWRSGLAFLNLLSLLLVTPLVAFYFLRDWDVMIGKFHDLLPRRHARTIEAQLQEIDRVLSGFLRGQTMVCLMLATYYAVALSLVGLNYALLIGLAAGLLAFLPYIGTFIGMAAGLSIAWVQYDGEWQRMATVLGVFLVAQFVEGNFITPKVVGSRVGLHPVWVIFGMLAGGALMGFVGVLIALPLTAVLGVLARFLIAAYKQSDLYGARAR